MNYGPCFLNIVFAHTRELIYERLSLSLRISYRKETTRCYKLVALICLTHEWDSSLRKCNDLHIFMAKNYSATVCNQQQWHQWTWGWTYLATEKASHLKILLAAIKLLHEESTNCNCLFLVLCSATALKWLWKIRTIEWINSTYFWVETWPLLPTMFHINT